MFGDFQFLRLCPDEPQIQPIEASHPAEPGRNPSGGLQAAIIGQGTTEVLVERRRHEIKPKSGGGILSYEVWGIIERGKARVTRCNLAYINQALCAVDHGRVLGYDNAHGYHRRHHMGQVELVKHVSYEATAELFQQEVTALLKAHNESKP